jgi:hypothetical protein
LPVADEDREGIVPSILGTREAILQTINDVRQVGAVTEEAIDKVLSVAGLSKDVFGGYIRSVFEAELASIRFSDAQEQMKLAMSISLDTLDSASTIISNLSSDLAGLATSYVDALSAVSRANRETAEAQTQLNEVTSYYDYILRELNAMLQETASFGEDNRLEQIGEAIATGLLTQEEQERLLAEAREISIRKQIKDVQYQRDMDIAASRDRLDAAREAEEVAQEEARATQMALQDAANAQLEAAQQQREVIAEQLATQKVLINFQQEQNDLIREQIRLIDQLAKQQAAKGGGGGGGAGGLDMDELLGGGDIDLEKSIDEAFDTAKKAMEDKLAEIKASFIKRIQPIIDAWEGLKLAWGPVFEEIGKITTDIWENTLKPKFEEIQLWLETNVPLAIDWFSEKWNEVLLPLFLEAKTKIEEDLLPALQSLSDFMAEHLPGILAFAAGFATVIGVVKTLGLVISLAGLAVAKAGVIIATIIATITNPVFLLAVAVGLLAAAWTENWFGIRDTLTDVWNNTLRPAFEDAREWIEDKITKALKVLTDIWENTLLPAMKGVWSWMEETLFPFYEAFWDFISAVFTVAIELLAGAWENLLLPAMKNVWNWIVEFFQPALDTLNEAWVLAKEVVEGAWKSLTDLGDLIFGPLTERFNAFKTNVIDKIKEGFEKWTEKIKDATKFFQALADLFKKVELPAWAKRDSPSEIEQVFMNVSKYMQQISRTSLPRFEAQMNHVMPDGAFGQQSTTYNIYRTIQLDISPHYEETQSPASIRYDVVAALSAVNL